MERVSDRHSPEVWSELLIEQLFLAWPPPPLWPLLLA